MQRAWFLVLAVSIACVGDSTLPPDGGSDATADSATEATGGDAQGDSGPSCATGEAYAWYKAGPASASTAYVTTDTSGNTIATAWYGAGTNFGTGALTSYGSWDTAVVKYDATGKLLWSIGMGGSQNDFGAAVATDSAGDVYAVGSTASPSMTIGTSTLTIPGSGTSAGFIVKLSGATGAFMWAKPVTSGAVNCDTVATNATRLVVGCEFAGGPASFSGTSVTNADPTVSFDDQLAIVTDLSGSLQWMRRIGGAGSDDTMGGVAIDAAGSVLVSGTLRAASPAFVDSANNATPITRVGTGPDASLMWLDPSGNLTRPQCFGNPTSGAGQSTRGAAVAVDGKQAYLTGSFNGTLDTKGGQITAASGTGNCGFFGTAPPCSDAFVIGIDKTTGATAFGKQIGGPNDELGVNIAVSGCNLLVSGLNLSANLTIDGQPVASPASDITTSGPWAMFAASYDPTGKLQWAKGLASADTTAAVSPGGGGFTGDGVRIGLGVQGSVVLDGTNAFNATASGQQFVVWALKRQ